MPILHPDIANVCLQKCPLAVSFPIQINPEENAHPQANTKAIYIYLRLTKQYLDTLTIFSNPVDAFKIFLHLETQSIIGNNI